MTRTEDLEHLIKDIDVIDGLVLCAGRFRSLPVLFSTREKFDEIYDVNFFSPLETLRLLVKKKKVSSNASSCLTGQSIVIDGGLTAK